jgi:hypothetical protein
MPYDSISAAKSAGFPTSADGAPLTLSQINKLASIYDSVKAAGTSDNPMAVAWTQWKKLYHKQGDGWVTNAAENTYPDGHEPVTLSFHQPKQLNFTDDAATGDTVFHDVTLIAEGTWTDGHSRQATYYSASELKKMQFNRRTLKMSHDIYGQAPITNEIGIIENQRFLSQSPARWVGDARIYPTTNGKDTATLLKRGQIDSISSELYLIPVNDPKNKRVNGTDLIFEGAATVRTGACTVCKFNEGDSSFVEGPKNMTDENTATGGVETSDEQKAEVAALTSQIDETKTADIKALEAQLAEAKTHNSHKLTVELFSANQQIADLTAQNKELMRKVAELEHSDKVRELQRQIKELQKAPVMHTVIQPNTSTQMRPVELDNDMFPAVFVTDME